MIKRQHTVLPKTKYSLRSKCEKWAIAPRESAPEKRLVLVTGTGRCGTTSMSRALTAIGLDVPHEKCGADGTASLFFAVDSDWHPMLPWYPGRNHVGERRSDYKFEHVLQIVRHPLRTIPSIGAIFNGLNYEFLEDNDVIPDVFRMPRLLRCAHVWYGLNKVIDPQAEYIFQMERLPQEWPKIMSILGQGKVPYPDLPAANRGTGYRKTEPTTWGALNALDPILTRAIVRLARRYGYE